LTRVLDVIDWAKISKGNPEAWLYFYEDFLSAYDNALRKKTGSYYTPPEIVTAMVRLVDEVLRDTHRFGVTAGLASPEVTLADPAVGTGTFLLGALRRIAKAKEDDEGPGAVPGAVKAALARLIGFEMQFGPFVVAQLRLLAEVADLMDLKKEEEAAPIALRLFLTNSLGNPNEEAEHIPTFLAPLGESRRLANEIKRTEPITVVIGNPPYKEKAKGLGGWVESGSLNTKADAPLNAWMPPADWNLGTHTKHLRNLYVYFWRWATWKVFGDAAAQYGDSAQKRQGIICYITVAGFLNGPGFEKMRSDLRRDTNDIWVIDCSPEGHQPEVPTRVFQGVQHPVCIVLAVRQSNCDPAVPARVRFRSLPKGPREDKFTAITQLTLNSAGWTDCPNDWRAPFLPEATGSWATFPGLDDLFVYNGSGVMPGRTWVIAPDAQSLRDRWKRLVSEKDQERKEMLFHPHESGDKHLNKISREHLSGVEHRAMSVAQDKGTVVDPVGYGFRSFDRQWLIPDNRLINRPNPSLWSVHSKNQVYLTALTRHSPTSGSPLTFTGLIPDLHHYKGSFGGRVFPLWLDNRGDVSNIKPGILTALARAYGQTVTGEDVLAYIAAVASHPAFTLRFKADLVQPGLRVPLTADAALFAEAVALGAEVIWLHTFGERFVSPDDGRSPSPPRLPTGQTPRIPKGGAIPADADSIAYDPATSRLSIGTGVVENVTPAMWAYEVSGKHVIAHWFSYRRKTRERPMIGDRRPPSPLGDIAKGWLDEYTTELLNLLNVLGRLIALEPKQADLLERVCAGPTLSSETLKAEGAFEVPAGVGVKSAKADAGGAQMSLLD
jgi:predicted helicase